MVRRRFFTVFGLAALSLLWAACEVWAQQRYQCEIANQSGRTVYVAIMGHRPGVESRPPGDGVLYANGPRSRYSESLFEGDRVVIVWDNKGHFLKATNVNVSGPLAIDIQPDGSVLSGYGSKP